MMRGFFQILFLTLFTATLSAPPKDADEGRPYEFGFTIDGEQHRHEKKDAQGIIQGEFGFITADGIYHVTVYATDENGKFKILSMRNLRISAPLDGSPFKGEISPEANKYRKQANLPLLPPAQAEANPLALPESAPQQLVTTKAPIVKFTTQPTIRPACASCGYVTTPKPQPSQNPLQQQQQQFGSGSSANFGVSIGSQPNAGDQHAQQEGFPQTPQSNSGQFASGYPNVPQISQQGLGGQPNAGDQDAQQEGFPQTPQSNSGQFASGSPNVPQISQQGVGGQQEGLPPGLAPQNGQQSLNDFGGAQGLQPPQFPSGGPQTTQSQYQPASGPQNTNYKPFGGSQGAGENNNYNQNSVSGGGENAQYPIGGGGTGNYNQNTITGGGQNTQYQNSVNNNNGGNGPFGSGGIINNGQVGSGGGSGAFAGIGGNFGGAGAAGGSTSPQGSAAGSPEVNPLQIPGTGLDTDVSTLPPVSVSGNVIHVGGDSPQDIPVRDKFPGMQDGLPAGVDEKDITDLLYKFHYTVGFHGHYEKGLKNGAKIGGYFVNGRDGISRIVTYIADENGYRPKVRFVNLGLDSAETPKAETEKTFGLKSFEFVWYPI